MSYATLLHEKNPYLRKSFLDDLFYSVRAFARIRQTLLLKILGGTDEWAVPQLKFWRDRAPSPPRSPPMVLREVDVFITIIDIIFYGLIS